MSGYGFKSASVNTSLTGPMLDASRLGGLTMPEKHELVYEIVKGSECGSEILQSWTRKELLHLICAEMGKERKYTGLPKCKMIEHLLRIVATKESTPQEGALVPFVNSTPTNAPSVFRRQRKKEHPLRLTAAITLPANADAKNTDNNRVCKNSACRAILNSEDVFCKRCSCCICYQFDDNKDPSVWLVCSSELLNEDISCGLSCHIECALKHRNAGVIKVGKHIQLDGSYSCASCGRVSGLIGFWKKQLTVAKDARRVDILCYRLSLSQRLLNGTDQFKEFHDIVLKAVRKLEEEVGPINGVSSKMARGIVSRLSTGLEVQKLCAMAIEKAEALLLSLSRSDSRVENPLPVACRLHFEDVSPTSLVVSLKEIDLKSSEDVGYKMWHRKSRELSYPRDLTCILPKTQRRALISNLQPCTEYAFKIVAFTNKGDIGQSEAKCFTKSVEVFRNRESSMIKGVHKKCGNLGMEDFTSTSAKGARENQSNEDDSSFRVRDLGKIWRAAWAQECEANDAFDSSERDIQINQFGFYEKDEACDSDKPFVSKDSKRNSSPTSPLEVSRDDQIGCNLVQVAEPEDDQEESISALDDERFMAGMGLVKMSHACQGSTKDLKKLKNGSRVNKLSKRKRENHSKVTSQKSSYCEHKQLTLHEMDELVPLDCSYPVFPINTCKVECPRSGRLKNTHSNSNGSDSGNWAVQLIRGAPTVDSQTGISRKRSLNTYDNLHGYDGVSQNGGQVPSSDPPDCLEKDFEYSVKIIRWLECRGHIKEEFRKKLLTWFSLRATSQERRIVYAFIETLLDDPASLAEQLVDTFLEIISIKKPQLSNGFCTKLWH